MASPRRRTKMAPLVLAAVAVALMAAPRAGSGSVRSTLALVFVPIASSARFVGGAASVVAGSAPADELEKQLAFFRLKAQELHVQKLELQARLEEITAIRGVVRDPTFKLLPASVVLHADGSAWRKSLLIARGAAHGVERGQLVLWEKHLIGRVIDVGPWTSRVQLVSDPSFKVGAVAVPRYQDGTLALSSRDTGVFEGSGDRHGVLKWLAGETTAEEGALVATTSDPTSGIPAGLILGRVSGVSRSRGPYPRVDVQPFVNARALESVTVVLGGGP